METKVMRIPVTLVPQVRKLIAEYRQKVRNAKAESLQEERVARIPAEPTVVMRVPVALEEDIQKLKEEHKSDKS